MAPYLLALALLLQDGPAAAVVSDGPLATAIPRKQDVAPLPIQGGAVTAPTDDYGYVGWCYGAISAYVDLYDRAMPEVIRIERAWPTPSTEENIAVVYPEQREEAKRNLLLFARAMEAAEKASPAVIQPQGAAAIKRGRAVWTGATNVPKAQLAQFWMSWSPPAKCAETAKTLEARSLLFGQALTYNAKGATAIVAAPPPEAIEPAVTDPQADAGLPPAPVATPEPPVVAEPEPAAATPGTPVASDVEIEPSAADAPMVYAQPEPSQDPEVSVDGAAVAAPLADATPDAAAQSAGAPEAAATTAIDDLLPAQDAPVTPTVEPEAPAAVATPVVTPAPTAKPAPAAAAPARKRKRGLKETLQGLRGPQ
jgi:hypothetical protein